MKPISHALTLIAACAQAVPAQALWRPAPRARSERGGRSGAAARGRRARSEPQAGADRRLRRRSGPATASSSGRSPAAALLYADPGEAWALHRIYAVVTPGFAGRAAAMDRLRAAVAGYANVEIVVSDLGALNMARPVDLVWTSENYHDLHNGPTAAPTSAVNRAVFGGLRPGGTAMSGGSCGAGDRRLGDVDPASHRPPGGSRRGRRRRFSARGGIAFARQSRGSAYGPVERSLHQRPYRQIRNALPQAEIRGAGPFGVGRAS